jgi:competence protein ComEC
MQTVWIMVIAWVIGMVAQDWYVFATVIVGSIAGLCIVLRPHDLRLCWLLIACMAGACRMSWYQWVPDHAPTELVRGTVTIQDVRASWLEQRVLIRGETGYGFLITLPPEPVLLRGMNLTVSGVIRPFEVDGSAYEAALRKRHVIGTLELHEPPLIASADGWIVFCERIRLASQRNIQAVFREPIASVVVGMLLGVGGDVSEPVAQAFRTSGTSHILVISGWNITIVAALCQMLLQACRVQGIWTLIIPLTVIGVYVIFTGASAAVVRAGYMGAVMVIGKWLDRPRDMWNIIAVAVWLMSAGDPLTLWDLGFQLSTFATIGLIGFGNRVDAVLSRTPLGSQQLGWAREGLAATIAAQIPTLPIMLCRLGSPSPWSLLANMIITPVVPFAMATGAGVTLIAWISPICASVAAWIAIPAFAWIIDGSIAIAALPAPVQWQLEHVWFEWCLHACWVIWLVLYGKRASAKPTQEMV